jgi:hypothetical protein
LHKARECRSRDLLAFRPRVEYTLVVSCFLLAACGKYPPNASSSAQIDRLPSSTPSARTRELRDEDVGNLARLKNLRMLFFSDGWKRFPSRITDRGVATLAKLDLPNLETLDFGYCDHITDAAFTHVATMRQVSDLQLRACHGITDAALHHIATMVWLKRLDVRGCKGITDAGLEALSSLTNLSELHLGGCVHVTPDGVARVQSRLPRTRVVKDEREWALHQPEEPRPH